MMPSGTRWRSRKSDDVPLLPRETWGCEYSFVETAFPGGDAVSTCLGEQVRERREGLMWSVSRTWSRNFEDRAMKRSLQGRREHAIFVA